MGERSSHFEGKITHNLEKECAMEKEKRSTEVRLDKIEKDYTRYFGKPQPSQELEVPQQGSYTQFTAYEYVRVSYAAATGR